jgi:hypothetical protein
VRRLLFIALFLEVGFVLIVMPWSVFWSRNYFAETIPIVHIITANNFVRGAVSGLGLVNVVAGLADLVSLLLARDADRPSSLFRSHTAED